MNPNPSMVKSLVDTGSDDKGMLPAHINGVFPLVLPRYRMFGRNGLAKKFPGCVISTAMLFGLPTMLFANGNCQSALRGLGTGWVAFNVTIQLPGQNASFISGSTKINSITTHQQHYADRTDGKSDNVTISINSDTSTLMVNNLTWNDHRNFDLACAASTNLLHGISGPGINLVLARATSPSFDVHFDSNGKADTMDARPDRKYSSAELADMILKTIRVLTQAEPSWVTQMMNQERTFGLQGDDLLAYRMIALNGLTGVQ